MNSQYKRLNAMMKNFDDIISYLKEEVDNISKTSQGSYLTDKERERYEEIYGQIANLERCAEYVENAMTYLEDYID